MHKKRYICRYKISNTMEIDDKAKKLRIYVSNTDMYKREPLYQFLARTARELGMAGATIYKGIMGYGTSSDLMPLDSWKYAEKVPVTIEIVDKEEQIRDYMATIQPQLDMQPKGCLVTMQDVDILFVKHGEKQ